MTCLLRVAIDTIYISHYHICALLTDEQSESMHLLTAYLTLYVSEGRSLEMMSSSFIL